MSITLIQISDCHLGDNADDLFLGLNTEETLLAVLDLVLEKYPNADVIVLSGDISNTAQGIAYPRLISYLQDKIGTQIPWLWLPGNHDDNALMQAAVGEGFLASEIFGHWQLSCLDSSIHKKVEGHIAASELERANNILQMAPDKHHLIFVHHHLMPVNCAWLDPQLIDNAQQVLQQWQDYPQLKLIVHGHVHQEIHQRHAHIDIIASPSTCIQFKPNSDEFGLDTKMPGFRVFKLADDGSYQTRVHRISERDLGIDYSIAGY